MPLPSLTNETLDGVIEVIEALPDFYVPRPNVTRVFTRFSQITKIIVANRNEKWMFRVLVQNNLTPNTIAAVIARLKSENGGFTDDWLLVTNYLTDKLIDTLIDERIHFIDTAGNMYLQQSGLYLLVRGNPPPRRHARDAFTPTNLAVIFGLLSVPALRRSTYREISEFSGVGLGSVSRAIKSLFEHGYLTYSSSEKLIILDYRKLLERWELGYLEAVRPRLGPKAYWFNTDDRAGMLEFIKEHQDFVVSGEEAAALLTGSFEPQSLTLHASTTLQQVLRRKFPMNQTEEQADIYLLKPFTRHDHYKQKLLRDELPLANPILVRTELLALGDKRLWGVASKLLEDVILPEFGGEA